MATWTAPGGDFDEGSVASYRFVYSEDIADLLRPDRRPKILLAFDRMEESGTDSSYDFEFPHYDTDYYVAAYGFDIAGNKGKISNLVHVRVPSPPKASNPIYGEDASSSSPIFSLSGGTNSDLDWIMIGVIAGVVGVLLVLSIVAISYYFVAARNGAARRRAAVSTHQGQTTTKKGGMLTGAAGSGHGAAPGSGPGSSTDETDSSSFDSDIKNIMLSNPPLGPTLSAAGVTTAASSLPPHMAQLQKHPHLHHHQQQHQQSSADSGVSSNGSHGEPTPTSGDPQNVTPVYWSASQLLSKLDHNTLPGNYSPYVTTVPGSGDPFGHSYGSHHHHHHHNVQPGPHSLQPYATTATASSVAGGAYSTSSGIPSEWPAFQQIPEEFTITVGNLSHSAAAAAASADEEASSRKVPPPVMPKPRNITQV